MFKFEFIYFIENDLLKMMIFIEICAVLCVLSNNNL